MEPAAASNKITYEEFEPYSKWQREEGNDILEVHLQGFKKEQLKVQLNNLVIMSINGDRWVDNSKRTGFQKEIAVPKDVKNKEIRAKFSNGILYITMPKETPPPPALSPPSPQNQPAILPPINQETMPNKTPPPPAPSPSPSLQNQPAILPPKNQDNEPKTPKTGPEDVSKNANKALDGKENGTIKEKDNHGSKENDFVLRLVMNSKMALCVIVTFAFLVVIGALLMSFRPSSFKM